jgi:hypothetical protein
MPTEEIEETTVQSPIEERFAKMNDIYAQSSVPMPAGMSGSTGSASAVKSQSTRNAPARPGQSADPAGA